ncbi:MAG: serine protease [Opitutaceae bacterium]|nr:serine protease [Opitutaceae bacterium]NBR59035.1 serine protease [Opitutaceae bacterium]
MNIVIPLFLLGVLLLAGEVFMPGAVLGILGALCMAAGCVLSFLQLGTSGGLVATVVALILLGLTLYVELIWLPKTKFGKKLIVQSTIAATSQPPLAAQDIVIGKMAEAVTPLMPTGYVLVEGHRYEAFSPAGHVAKGALLRVSGLDNFRLIVTKP